MASPLSCHLRWSQHFKVEDAVPLRMPFRHPGSLFFWWAWCALWNPLQQAHSCCPQVSDHEVVQQPLQQPVHEVLHCILAAQQQAAELLQQAANDQQQQQQHTVLGRLRPAARQPVVAAAAVKGSRLQTAKSRSEQQQQQQQQQGPMLCKAHPPSMQHACSTQAAVTAVPADGEAVAAAAAMLSRGANVGVSMEGVVQQGLAAFTVVAPVAVLACLQQQ
jgi:hypothetical protein